MDINLQHFFQENNIQYKLYTHPPLFTCEDVQKCELNMEGIDAKSLLLKSKETESYFLILLPFDVKLDMKSFSQTLGVKKLSFANEEELMNILHLKPGSVSPFGLFNDTEKKAKLFIHTEIWASKKVTFHPNVNTETVEMDHDEFKRCLELFNVTYTIF